MKKTFGGILIIGLLTMMACKKDNSTPTIPLQTWTFKSITYNTVECFADTSTNNLNLSANNGSAVNINGYCALACYFYGKSLPATGGTYTVALVNAPDTSITATQVTLRMVFGGSLNSYMSTGGSGNETVSITINNGKLNITGSGIEMAHYYGAAITDSAALAFNITQTQ